MWLPVERMRQKTWLLYSGKNIKITAFTAVGISGHRCCEVSHRWSEIWISGVRVAAARCWVGSQIRCRKTRASFSDTMEGWGQSVYFAVNLQTDELRRSHFLSTTFDRTNGPSQIHSALLYQVSSAILWIYWFSRRFCFVDMRWSGTGTSNLYYALCADSVCRLQADDSNSLQILTTALVRNIGHKWNVKERQQQQWRTLKYTHEQRNRQRSYNECPRIQLNRMVQHAKYLRLTHNWSSWEILHHIQGG